MYTFVKKFKPQYLLVVVTCAFMGFWYSLYSRLGLNLLKNKCLFDYQLILSMEMKRKDWEGEIKELLLIVVTELIYNHYFIIDG